MKRIGTVLMVGAMVTLLAQAVQAELLLVAGWDDGFSGSTGWSPNYKAADTTVSVAASGQVRSWSQWNNNDWGGSDDGTFGDLSTGVAGAITANSGSGRNLSLNTSDGTLVFTLTNDSALSRTVDGFYFDVARRYDSANAWFLSYSGAISGTGAGGSIPTDYYGMSGALPSDRNQGVDLTVLTDNVWEAGTDAVFTLAFTGSDNSGSGGGEELLVDNIGITANVIPEPASIAMMLAAIAGVGLLRRKLRR